MAAFLTVIQIKWTTFMAFLAVQIKVSICITDAKVQICIIHFLLQIFKSRKEWSLIFLKSEIYLI